MRLEDFVIAVEKALQPKFSKREWGRHVDILFEHYLGLNRAEVILNVDRVLSDSELFLMQNALNEILKNKPIDYIINESYFYSRPFYVDESVLIPRPETEELVLWILEKEESKEKSILDIGTGSGCIPITLSLEGEFHQVDALEVSEIALQTARRNADSLKANVRFFQMDILTQMPDKKYNIVVSNPPYVKREELEELDANVVDYEPSIALAPEGDDPLIFYKRMIIEREKLLKPGGVFYWEIHEDLGKEILSLLDGYYFSEVELKEDIYGRDRLVRAKLS